MKKLAPMFSIALTLLVTASAAAQESMSSPAECQLRMATGKKGKGFSRIHRDLRAVCGAEVTLCEVETEGGLQNAIALSANEADVGIVQLDTLLSMKDSDENIASLQAIVPMHANSSRATTERWSSRNSASSRASPWQQWVRRSSWSGSWTINSEATCASAT
jgi:TRAP-type uncharacterized transport system substrate-binding protein